MQEREPRTNGVEDVTGTGTGGVADAAGLADLAGLGPQTDLVGGPDLDGAPTQETGTTVVGVRTETAVVLAADRRASLGGQFVSNKDVRKVEAVHPRAAMGLSGGVGAVQALARQVRAEADLYDARRGSPPTMRALSTLVGDLVRGVPAQLLLGGVDAGDGDPDPALYELDGGGAVTSTAYAAAGSGLQVAYGVLERVEGEDPDTEQARSVAADAVAAASERDTASGNGLTLATITADGVEFGGER